MSWLKQIIPTRNAFFSLYVKILFIWTLWSLLEKYLQNLSSGVNLFLDVKSLYNLIEAKLTVNYTFSILQNSKLPQHEPVTFGPIYFIFTSKNVHFIVEQILGLKKCCRQINNFFVNLSKILRALLTSRKYTTTNWYKI